VILRLVSRVEHVKRDPGAPAGFFEAEAAGLAWLGEVPGAAPTVDVLDVGPGRISLARLDTASPTVEAAERLGRQLARTHAAGARGYGAPPDGWDRDGFIGPLPLPHAPTPPDGDLSFGAFYAEYRVEPFLRRAGDAGTLDAAQVALVARVSERLVTGEVGGPPEPVSRLHGDLWSGNVLWTPSGAVLIDPAAHGGHRETDLAMLALFGLPHLDRALAAYQEVAPLADGWRERVALHQLHPLLVHTVLFGGGYAEQAVGAARRYG
jgi:fructosamine-3-kinase